MFKPDPFGTDPLQCHVATRVSIIDTLSQTATGKVRKNRVRTELPR